MDFTLRRWTENDAQDKADFTNNEEVLKWLWDGVPIPYTKQNAIDWINSINIMDKNDGMEYCIDVDGKAVGTVGYIRGESMRRYSCEIGYFLSQSYWKQGIMSTAVSFLCNHIFEYTDIVRIYAEVYEGNTASQSLLKKCGFTHESTQKKAVIKDGQMINLEIWTLIKE